ncbi:MAG: SDR family oxidoreductase [Pseudomonadota bacterium]
MLITGATAGIGACLARDYVAAGYNVIATGTRADGPAGTRYVRADQAEPEAAAAEIAAAVGGHLDVAILNAGLGRIGAAPEAEAARMLDVNLVAPVLIAHAIAPAILAAGGVLILVGSSMHRGAAAAPTYAATKAGLHGLARALASEWQGRAHVAVLHPGATDTGMLARSGLKRLPPRWMLNDPAAVARAIEDAVARRAPSGRIGRLAAWRARGLARDAARGPRKRIAA